MNKKQQELLRKELETRGIAEITANGDVLQVTYCISESENKVTYSIFGEIRDDDYIPIENACLKCNHIGNKEICKRRSKIDAMKRNFNKVICPKQIIIK